MKSTKAEKPTFELYERIFSTAWHVTKKNPLLWIVGFVAGLLYSGSLLQGAISQTGIGSAFTFSRVGDGTITAEILAGTQEVGRSFLELSSGDKIIAIVTALLLISVIVMIAMAAQHVLISSVERAREKKEPVALREVMKTLGHTHLLRLFLANAVFFLFTAAVDVVTLIAVLQFLPQDALVQLIFAIGVIVVVFPITLAANAAFFFWITHIVREDLPLAAAIVHTKESLKNHWLTALELAFMIFVINAIALVLLQFINTGLQVILLPIFSSFIVANSYFVLLMAGFASVILFILTHLLPFGALTVFNYAAWVAFVNDSDAHGIKPWLERFFHRT